MLTKSIPETQTKPVSFDYHAVEEGHYDSICTQGNALRHFWHQYRFSRIEDLMQTTPASKILDLGCANGTFLGQFSKPYASAVGVELSESQVRFAERKYGSNRLTFVAGDIRDHRFNRYDFDFIVFSEVIEHIGYNESLTLLRRIRQLLNPGGKLIMTTPNYRSLWPILEFFVNRLTNVSYEHQHINKLNTKTSSQLIRRAGFHVESIQTTHILAPFFAFLSKEKCRQWCDWEARVFPSWGSEIFVVASKSP